MRIAIVAVGRLKDAWVQAGCDEYGKRVRRALPFESVEVKDDDDLQRKIPPRHKVWALDQGGRQLSSQELADALETQMNRGEHGIAFVIGGADGLRKALIERADFVWSLGRMTLPHRLARLIVTEQLYRALSIVRGEPYHRP